MSTLPAFVNAVFTLNKKGEYVLYEGDIEGGYTKVSITTNIAQGYNTRYYKVKQIIALEGQQAIKQSFDLPSQEFAYRMIEKSIIESISIGDNDESNEIPVVVTGQHVKSAPVNTGRASEVSSSAREDFSNSNNTYQSVVATQSRKLAEGSSSGILSEEKIFGGTSFNDLSSLTGTGSFEQEFNGGVKIANMSSFADGSNSTGNGNKASSFDSLESALEGNW